MNDAVLDAWQQQARRASQARQPLRIRGGGSKDFYGGTPVGELLDTRGYAGIVDYEPSELVVTVRCGTPLAELEAALRAQGQMLAFEPPHFGGGATVGGMLAAGLSGPRRQAAGAVRDFVLGMKVMDATGQALSFGGRVMKNVAGYDVSRLMAGSLGTLGLILEASIKTLPLPVSQATLRFQVGEQQALDMLNRWGGRPLPISASIWKGGQLYVRLSGAEAAVREAVTRLDGEVVIEAGYWDFVREQRFPVFPKAAALWRLSVPSTTPAAAFASLPGERLIEWGGAQRWLALGEGVQTDGAALREAVSKVGGHATLFRGGDKAAGVFQPLAPALMGLHRKLKAAFDPQGIFNPGRMYPDL